jgi:hypothetical protein
VSQSVSWFKDTDNRIASELLIMDGVEEKNIRKRQSGIAGTQTARRSHKPILFF